MGARAPWPSTSPATVPARGATMRRPRGRRPRSPGTRRGDRPGRGPGLAAPARAPGRRTAAGRCGQPACWRRGSGTPGPPENRSAGHLARRSAPESAENRDSGPTWAETLWSRAVPIPAAAEHPARRWLAARHLWWPEMHLPPSTWCTWTATGCPHRTGQAPTGCPSGRTGLCPVRCASWAWSTRPAASRCARVWPTACPGRAGSLARRRHGRDGELPQP